MVWGPKLDPYIIINSKSIINTFFVICYLLINCEVFTMAHEYDYEFDPIIVSAPLP